MSRTAFAMALGGALGISPIQHLTEWRVAEAGPLLGDPQQAVAQVAERPGHQSEAAFRCAFKRVEAVGLGQIRRKA